MIEDCPVCKQHTFEWKGYNYCVCNNPDCGWWPCGIPWDEDEVNEAIEKQKLDKVTNILKSLIN